MLNDETMRIYVGQFVYRVKGGVVDHHVVRIRLQIIKTKTPLIIRIDAGERGSVELQLHHDLVGRKVALGDAHLPDNSAERLLSRTAEKRNRNRHPSKRSSGLRLRRVTGFTKKKKGPVSMVQKQAPEAKLF